MKKFTNFNFGDSRMDREWTEVEPRMDRLSLGNIWRSEAMSANHALITQLSRNNHPISLRAIRYAAALTLFLCLGVTEVWGGTGSTFNKPYFFYYNDGGWSKCMVLYGREWNSEYDGYTPGHYTKSCNLSLVGNTEKLYYAYIDDYWNDSYNEIAVVEAENWSAERNKIGDRWGSVNHTDYIIQNYSIDYWHTYFWNGKGASSLTHCAGGAADITKYTTTLNIKVKESGAGSYSNGSTSNKPASTIKITGSYVNDDNRSTAARSDAAWSSSNSCSYASVVSGKVTVSYSSLGSNWNFDGWYIGSSRVGTGTSYEFYQTANTTVEARFTRKYSVTYNANGSTSGSVPSVSGTKYLSGTNVTLATNTGSLAKKDYALIGWNTAKDGTGTHYDLGATLTSISSDQTLYAEWLLVHVPGVYEDTYKKSLKEVSGVQYEWYSISKNGSGWFILAGEQSSSTNGSANNVAMTLPSTKAYKHQNWFTVKYESTDGSGTPPRVGEFGDLLSSSAPNIKFKETAQSLKMAVSGYSQFSFVAKDNDADKSKNKYIKVIIDGSDVTALTTSSSWSIRSFNITPSDTHIIELQGTGNAVCQFMAFAFKLPCAAYTVSRGGQTDGTFTVGSYNGSELTCTPSVSGTYTYQWKQYMSGQGVGDTINAVGSGANTNSFTPTPASAGTYYYMCRVLNVCGDKQVTSTTGTFVFSAASTYTVSASVNPSGYGTLSTSSISGVASGTSISASSNVLTVGASSITATKASSTTQWSYAFTNWTKSDGTALPSTVTADLSVYANFSRTGQSYTVTLDKQVASNTPTGSVSATYGSAMPSIGTLPSHANYTFGGFYSAVAGGGTCYYNGSGTSQQNSDFEAAGTLYAKFTQSVTLDKNGGTKNGSATATYAGTVGSISAPTYTGHTVDGYYAESGCSNKVMTAAGVLQESVTDGSSVVWTDASSKWKHAAASTLYAHWKCDAPTITDDGDNTVSISVPSGTTVRYTTDGTTPSSSVGTVYSSAFTVASNCTVKAVAYQTGCTDSEMASRSITLCTPVFGSVTFDNNKSEKRDISYNTSTDVEVIGTATWTQSGVSSDTGHPMTKPAMKLDDTDDYIKITLPSGITSGTITIQACTYKGDAGTLIINDENNSTTPLASAEVGQKDSKAYYKVNSPDGDSWTAPTLKTLTYSSISAGGDFYIKKSSGANIYVYAFSATSESACPKPTITATRLTAEYMPTGSSGVQIGVAVTGASSGWKYRVKNKNGGYETPDNNTYSTSTWTMTSTIGTGANTYKVELYDNSATPVKKAVSSVITVYGEVAYPMTISAGDGGSVSPTSTQANGAGDHLHPTITATPSDGYHFVNWTLSNSNATLDDEDAATTTITSASGACTITANFAADCTKPGTPTRPTIEDGTLTHAGATFVWDPDGATANSDGYNVSIVKVSDGSTVLSWTSEGIGTEGGAAVYTATGLTGSTEYYFIVKAIGADGYCSYGDTSRLTFTTLGTPYTITYHLNGASWINEGAATYRYGTGYTLPVAGDMTNTGYTFEGWFDNSGLTGSSVTTIGTSESGNKEFWAEWTENTYTVTYSANGGTGDAMSNTVGHYVTLSTNTYTNSGYVFAGWNTATDGSGASYSEGEEIELKADLDLYAIWATDYTITWDASPKLSGVDAKPNLGGGNYTITASVSAWTGLLDASMISAETSGVTITGVSVNNSASPKTITATFNVGASVVGDKISFTLDVPANGSYSAKSSTEDFDIDRCTGNSSGSDGVLFSAEFKDSGLGTSDICTAANTDYTFTTSELKAAPTGGSISAYTTSTLSHMKFAGNAISIAGSDGVIRIDLDNPIAENDLFTYLNVNSSTSAAYLRHTSPTTTTDQIALTVYNSKEAKVRLTSGFADKTTLYIVRNNKDFKLHKAAVVRPAFLMLLSDDTPTSDTNLAGTDQGLTTGNYLAVISGGSATFTSPSSGNLKIKRNNSKNYINFNNAAGYVKIVLNDALQEGDVIGFDSYNTNELAFTSTSTRSTSIRSSGQLYTVDASSDLKGKSTFYIWQNSGSSDFLRGLQIARSGVAGGGGGTDKITTTLTWDTDLSGGVAKETGDADFTHTVTQDKNSLGAITYSSSNTSVASVNASGKVHIVGAGNATITATMAASGCYKEATVSYNITVTDNCADVAGTISTEDLGCDGIQMTVTGHTTSGETVSYQWYKDGVSLGSASGAQTATYTATEAGEYYVIVTNTGSGHCSKASTNTITLEDSEAATASKIVNSWYVKNGRRTPDIALVQTTGATDFIVKSGDSPITTFAGCAFYLGTDGIIYLKGQQEDGSAPTGLTSGNETLKFTATACGGNSSELSITIHKQDSTARPSVAFVVDGEKEGDFDEEEENHSVNTELYQYLDYGADETGAFDLTGQNVYSTVDEQAIREHYSQFDAILITDDPSTDTKIGKKSCVNAFGTMIDVRPILTMEAFVSKWGNWKAKGIDGNPESPNPRQYKMKLQCKDHAIFKDLSVGTNVETETIDGVEYWTVTMVDNTKSPYSGVADGTDTDTKPALQGFSADDVNSLLLLGQISGGSLYAGVERQEETAARLMLLGLNAKALPNALTPEGKKVIENALEYLIETDLEKVDDCSNYFTGATDKDWNKDSNWSKNHVPNSPNVRVRILSECVIYSGTYKVAEVDIATSGKSLNKTGEMTGKLTINAGAALIVGGKIRTAEAPYFNTGDLKPTTVNDLIINTSSTAQAGLVFNNDAGDTKATVNLYSLGRTDGNRKYQYFAIPMEYIPVNPTFANETYGGTKIFTYVYHEASGWERRGYYTDLYAFEGIGITTSSTDTHMDYTMTGTLASTATQEITLTNSTDGYNMVGNSWSAPIQIDQLSEDNTDDNIVKTAYIYCSGNDGGTGVINATYEEETAGQWIPIPFATSGTSVWRNAGKLSVIPAMQAYQIQVNDEATLTLDYSKVVRGSNNSLTEKLRAPKRQNTYSDVPMSIIRVKDSKTYTDVCLLEGEQFSEEFDNGWEAEYMAGDGPSAALYAQTEIGHMAVAAVPELEGTVLGFAPGQELEYTFTFIGSDMGYYLNDLKLKKSTPINAENSYTFTFEEGDTNRFYISSTPIDAPQTPTGVDNTHSGEVKAQKFIYNDKMYIMINGRVYSAEGQIVK